ncbi:hypothetical protein CWI38_0528p0010 [Hamiltosporidium tvaerminnensis]|uniref:Uncharacterized protein n=1 Tax=Hamiltosporidium tvaerminnensis TaxID=1176355 RepID=A0A4Q9LZ76_9MICR|nr:hypothetical protein CWI38_0528p0010 [Hamiltosporidium tvaerminnensis]
MSLFEVGDTEITLKDMLLWSGILTFLCILMYSYMEIRKYLKKRTIRRLNDESFLQKILKKIDCCVPVDVERFIGSIKYKMTVESISSDLGKELETRPNTEKSWESALLNVDKVN